MRKAISLISGGLDSMLATKLVLEQGVHVEGINFFTGFTGDHSFTFKKIEAVKYNAKWICDQLGIKLHVINVVDGFKPILLNPQYGYGANLNPCLDCKLFMVMQAKKWLVENNFDFMITGEVLGQRPKSQRKDTLPMASKITDDLIVRPLSAKLLPPTLPEREGWLKRELLCNFNGRSRKPQMALAKKFGFKEFPQPAGGCVLTDGNFCKRLQDLLDHRQNRDYSVEEILLLRVGRHLRVKPNIKVIVGRDEIENNYIQKFSQKYILLQTTSYPGALILIDGVVNKEELEFMAQLAAYFSKGRDSNEKVAVAIKDPVLGGHVQEVVPCAKENILQKWYV